jgi:cytochrome P450
VLRSAGDKHARYRAATSAALGGIDLYQLHDLVERVAAPLINAFAGDGHCEVIAQYALPLAFTVINELVGCSAELGQRIAAGMVAMFDGVGAAAGGAAFFAALGELVQEKRANPGADVTTRMMRHPIELTDEEMTHQLVPVYGAGIEPAQNLITNTLLLMLTDDRFAAGILGGALSTRDALDEVLFNDPPLANFCMSYPRQPVMMGRIWLPAHQPVVISLAACNRDPEIRGRTLTDNRAHLAFGAGPHACPARPTAQIIAQDAIDQLLDALPEIELAVQPAELVWRQGAFHRALSALPVRFPPSPPIPEHHHISAS